MDTGDMKGKKVLIVEDDFFVSDIYETKFKHEGCEVVAVGDGAKAFSKLQEGFVPDVILLDLIMPNMDGREFLEEVKKLPNLAAVPILVLSNLSQEEDVEESLALGAKDYIVKSHLTPTEIFHRVREFLQGSVSGEYETVIK
ncbi:MAG: response regulator [Candidatus Moraniibacteriota bacterium]|nr:MAG: response regulator [Candidatus Moranbacteria bacterium]